MIEREVKRKAKRKVKREIKRKVKRWACINEQGFLKAHKKSDGQSLIGFCCLGTGLFYN